MMTEAITIGDNKFIIKILSKGEPAMTQEQYETAKKRASELDLSLGKHSLVDKEAREIFEEKSPHLKGKIHPGYLKFDPNSNIITAFMRPPMHPSSEVNLELTDDVVDFIDDAVREAWEKC